MKFKPVKIAVIGCGRIFNAYMNNLSKEYSIIEVVGCSDLMEYKSKEKAEKYGIRQMTNEEILSDPEIEIVLNLTNAASHYQVSKQILEAGKHCYVEKMVCINEEDAAELYKLSKEKNLMFSIAPDTFLGASQQTSRYIIDKGLIGTPIHALVHLSRGYFMIKNDEDDAERRYSVMEKGGGIPFDMGGYYLHQMFNLFGNVKRVCGMATTNNPNRPYLNPRHSKFNENFFVDTPNTISAVLEFENGVHCIFAISSEHNTPHEQFEVYGTEGRLILGNPNEFGEPVYLQKGLGEPVSFPLTHPYSAQGRGIAVADMAWALRTGRDPRLSTEMGMAAFEIIHAIMDCTVDGQVKEIKTKFKRPEPISSEFYGGACQERSLVLY